MTYLHCPRCRLAIRYRAHYLTLTNCPRCLAHAAITAPLFASPLNGAEMQAARPRAPAARARWRSALVTDRAHGGTAPAVVGDRVTVLPRSPRVSAAARDAVRQRADELGPERTADACLLVSELATNAFVHGRGVIRLSIAMQAALAHFAVHDDGDGTPRLAAHPGEQGGWGLQIVDRVAARWGIQTDSTLVWFELHAPTRPADADVEDRAVIATASRAD